MLPDRDLVLQVVDQHPAGLEGLAAVRAGHGHDHREIADGQVADPVDRGQGTDRVLGHHAFGDAAHLGLGRRVAGVAERVDVRPAVVVAHRADEERRSARRVVADGREDLVDRERGLTDLEEPDRVRSGLLAGVVEVRCHAAIVHHRSHIPE